MKHFCDFFDNYDFFKSIKIILNEKNISRNMFFEGKKSYSSFTRIKLSSLREVRVKLVPKIFKFLFVLSF